MKAIAMKPAAPTVPKFVTAMHTAVVHRRATVAMDVMICEQNAVPQIATPVVAVGPTPTQIAAHGHGLTIGMAHGQRLIQHAVHGHYHLRVMHTAPRNHVHVH